MVQQVSFMVRVSDFDQERLRGQIEHIPTGTTAHFRDLAQAELFIRSYLAGALSRAPRAGRSTGEAVSSIFSFLRRPDDEPQTPAGESSPATPATDQPAPSAAPPAAAAPSAAQPAAAAARSGGGLTPPITLQPYGAALLDLLRPFLPPLASGLPPHTLGFVSLNQRSLGLGGRRGMLRQGGLDVAELRGGWLEAIMRFDLWGADIDTVNDLAADLQSNLLGAAPTLRGQGLLQMRLDRASDAAAEDSERWRRQLDYAVLYEYRYQDTDGAASLIARIPIHGQTDFSDVEITTITDYMVRWDDQAAPALVIRPGPRAAVQVNGLDLAAFLPGGGPAGTVTRLVERNGTATTTSFGSLEAFLADFVINLSPLDLVTLPPPLLPGEVQSVRAFQVGRLRFDPPIVLRGDDRFEVSFSEAAFPADSPAQVYLQAAVGG